MKPLRAALATASIALALLLGAAVVGTSTAAAHAELLGTVPESGATVGAAPREVIFKFNQDVGGTAGAVRVYDAQGAEVDDLEVGHPGGNQHWMGVGLKRGLPDGTYTATYRVISADTHIVYGGLVFNVGRPSASSTVTVAGLIGRSESGRVTKVAFGLVRALNYLTLALMAGGLAFLLFVWPRSLFAPGAGPGDAGDAAAGDAEDAGAGGSERRWARAARAAAARLEKLLVLAVALGASVSALGVLLQGASAAGVSLWSSLKGSVVQDTLESRFGWVWAARAAVWLVLGAILLISRGHWRGLTRTHGDPAGPSDPAGAAPARNGRRRGVAATVCALALGSAYLLLTPALAGHASVESPRGVFFPADVIHVAAGSIWVGGIACLLFVLPAATRRLQGEERTRLLLATLARFSPLALGSVIAIAVTGTVQAYIDVRSLHSLLHTTYGVLILAKTALLLLLIVLGWINRARVIPALERVLAAASTPGETGRLARRTMRGELALMVGVFGVTAALISYSPPIDTENGPFSTDTTIGPAELEMTVDPARMGPNTIHLYLIDAKSGAQFTATKELTVTASLPAKGIGPLKLHATLAGPGHYVLNSAVLSPAGSWQLEVVDRVSEFEQHTRRVEVPIG
ncbi:MAG TPA: CopD family protein [Solirubrobacteraceae bacterium]|nr:CopD family protein [Solirubrobacteraceae bacterium]